MWYYLGQAHINGEWTTFYQGQDLEKCKENLLNHAEDSILYGKVCITRVEYNDVSISDLQEAIEKRQCPCDGACIYRKYNGLCSWNDPAEKCKAYKEFIEG